MSSSSAHVFIEVPLDPIAEPQPVDSQPVTFPVIQPTGPEGAPAPQSRDHRDAEAQRDMSVYCFTGCILIHVLGENYGDSSGRLWMMYLTEADKEDKDITESWKGDTDGILVFVGTLPSNFCVYYV